MPKTTCLSRAVILLPILSLAAAAQVSASNQGTVKMLVTETQVRVAAGTSETGASNLYWNTSPIVNWSSRRRPASETTRKGETYDSEIGS
jgi:hypothetical protein